MQDLRNGRLGNLIRLYNVKKWCHLCAMPLTVSHQTAGSCSWNHVLCDICHQQLSAPQNDICHCRSEYHNASCQYSTGYPSCVICFALENRQQARPGTVLHVPSGDHLDTLDLPEEDIQALKSHFAITRLLQKGLRASQRLNHYQTQYRTSLAELAQLKAYAQQLDQQITNLRSIETKCQKLQTECSHLRSQLNQQTQERIDQLEQENQALQQQVTQLQSQQSTYQKQIKEQQATIERLKPLEKIGIPSETAPANSQQLADKLKELSTNCLICLETYDIFHYGLTSCCNAIICLECQSKISQVVCPSCRRTDYSIRPLSIYEKRLIQTLLLK